MYQATSITNQWYATQSLTCRTTGKEYKYLEKDLRSVFNVPLWHRAWSCRQISNSSISVIHNFTTVGWVSEWVSRVYRSTWHIISQFRNNSSQAIDCTGTDNRKQGNKTLNTFKQQKINRKKPVQANKTNLIIVWYAFYSLQQGNGVGPISITLKPTWSNHESTEMAKLTT